MHQTSYNKMKGFVSEYLDPKTSLDIIDIGSQDVNGSYRDLFNYPDWYYTGTDLEGGSGVDLVLHDPYCWKELKTSSFDVVVSGQALEHIEYFWITMLEIQRIMKPGGLCCIIVPSAGYEHRYPVDCYRFYADGFNALARYAHLSALEIYTQKEDVGVEGDIWRDTVMIAKKERQSFLTSMKLQVKSYILKSLL